MASLNRVQIIGNLGQDPTTRYLPDGTAATNVSIATSERWTDKASGEKKESVEWHKAVFWGRLAEVAGEYLKKGAQIYVEGSLRTRKWQDKDGNDRYTTEIRADRLVMLGSRGDSEGRTSSPSRPGEAPAAERQAPKQPTGAVAGGESKPGTHKPTGSKFDDFEDSIPF